MKTIGITGGIGAGKTQVMNYLKETYSCIVLLADEIAHLLKEQGQPCYEPLVALMGAEILQENGTIHKQRMAERIFNERELLVKINEIIHPAVKQYIRQTIAKEQEKGQVDFLFLEAALLIEENYEEILDEIWYIYADDTKRRERLKEARNYSEEKIEQIFANQLKEADFRRHCKVVINNSNTIEETYKQIDKKLEEYL